MFSYESFSPEETYQLACCLGRKLKGGELIALEGELGAGKTHFVKGLACGLEAKEPVTSPTFTLLHIYEGRVPLAHFDVYRLPTPGAIEELGYEEYFYGPGVTAIEWSDLVESYLPSEYLQIVIKRKYSQDCKEGRSITIIPHGKGMEDILEELKRDACSGH